MQSRIHIPEISANLHFNYTCFLSMPLVKFSISADVLLCMCGLRGALKIEKQWLHRRSCFLSDLAQ